MKQIALFILAALIGGTMFTSCINNDYDDPTIVVPEFELPDGASMITVADLKAKYTAKFPSTDRYLKENQFVTVSEDVYISGYVISDDKDGNFYKSLVIQEDVKGSTPGMSISIGEANLNSKFAKGQKIFIKCKGLVLGKYGGEVQLGAGKVYYKDREWRLTPIASPSISFHIFNDKTPVTIIPKVKKISELTEDDKFTYIKVEDVQFVDPNGTWGKIGGDHDPNFPFNTDSKVADEDGNELPMFTSNYSKFAHLELPKGNGSIEGILSFHNSKKQFIVNSLNDVKMDKARFGTVFTVKDNFTIDFNDVKSLTKVTGLYNIKEAGSRDWLYKVFTDSKTKEKSYYAQASGYKAKDSKLVFWMITPAVNVSTQKTFSVSTAKAFWNHQDSKHPVEVLYSSDFNGTNLKTATWKKLNVKIAQKTDGNNAWINSGDVKLPILAGKHISIAFKYTGSKDETTTFRVDNVVVK
jgi:hypothetical protein